MVSGDTESLFLVAKGRAHFALKEGAKRHKRTKRELEQDKTEEVKKIKKAKVMEKWPWKPSVAIRRNQPAR